MSAPRLEAFTEEAFVLASLKEFVKLWGSGSQAFFQLQCVDGQAALKFSSQLGPPAQPHFTQNASHQQHRHPHHLHGFHAEEPSHYPRKKSQKQRDRDRVRAAAHRARNEENATAVTADKDSSAGTQPSSPPASGGDGPAPPPTVPTEVAATAANLSIPPCPEQAVPAVSTKNTAAAAAPAPLPSSNSTGQAHQVTLSEVKDELVPEDTEVKVLATGVFENCPDSKLSDEYHESLRKFILSERHLQESISCVKFAKLPSRQLGWQHFVHTVKVEITVKTARLCETPLAYLKKHLETNDWLKSNKTKITVIKFHV